MSSKNQSQKHTAGALDIRNVIGALLAIYGVILVATRLFAGDAGGENSEGVNANLWAGVGLLVVGAIFLVWARVRPVIVPETKATPDDMVKPD